MCQLCQTADQRTARAAFLAAMRHLYIVTYNDLVGANLGGLSSGSFSPSVRDFVVNRIPKVAVAYVPVVCPTCNKPKDARSVELDHIIPVRCYVRYKLIDAHAGLNVPLGPAMLSQVADNAYIDQPNLIFICKSCNKNKSDRMPTDAMSRHGTDTVMQRLRANLPKDRHANLALLNQMMARINLPSSLGAYLRGELMVKKTFFRDRRKPARYRDTPYPTTRLPQTKAPPQPPRLTFINADTGADHHETIHQVVGLPAPVVAAIEDKLISMFGGSRASIHELMGDAAFRALLQRQTRAAGPQKDLRVCMYCQGMFHKQAFQIEHLDPVDRDPVTGSQVPVNVYNHNLIAICGSCNGSRGKKTLTRKLLADLRAARIADGLPGLESVCTDMQNAATTRIHALLGI